MKPTLRSFFSGVPASANASVAVLKRKELRDGGERRGSPDRFQERPARGIFRKHRAHHRRRNDALVTFLFVRNRLASQRERRLIVLGFGPMLTARRSRPATADGRNRRDRQRWTCLHFPRASDAAASRHTIKFIARPRIRPGDEKTCRFYAAFSVSLGSTGRPSSIGSEGSRDHSFQEPKYIRTSFTPAFFSARKVFEARAPLKQYR